LAATNAQQEELTRALQQVTASLVVSKQEELQSPPVPQQSPQTLFVESTIPPSHDTLPSPPIQAPQQQQDLLLAGEPQSAPVNDDTDEQAPILSAAEAPLIHPIVNKEHVSADTDDDGLDTTFHHTQESPASKDPSDLHDRASKSRSTGTPPPKRPPPRRRQQQQQQPKSKDDIPKSSEPQRTEQPKKKNNESLATGIHSSQQDLFLAEEEPQSAPVNCETDEQAPLSPAANVSLNHLNAKEENLLLVNHVVDTDQEPAVTSKEPLDLDDDRASKPRFSPPKRPPPRHRQAPQQQPKSSDENPKQQSEPQRRTGQPKKKKNETLQGNLTNVGDKDASDHAAAAAKSMRNKNHSPRPTATTTKKKNGETKQQESDDKVVEQQEGHDRGNQHFVPSDLRNRVRRPRDGGGHQARPGRGGSSNNTNRSEPSLLNGAKKQHTLLDETTCLPPKDKPNAQIDSHKLNDDDDNDRMAKAATEPGARHQRDRHHRQVVEGGRRDSPKNQTNGNSLEQQSNSMTINKMNVKSSNYLRHPNDKPNASSFLNENGKRQQQHKQPPPTPSPQQQQQQQQQGGRGGNRNRNHDGRQQQQRQQPEVEEIRREVEIRPPLSEQVPPAETVTEKNEIPAKKEKRSDHANDGKTETIESTSPQEKEGTQVENKTPEHLCQPEESKRLDEKQAPKEPQQVEDIKEKEKAEQERAEKRLQKKLRKREQRLEKFESILKSALYHRRQRILQRAWKGLQDLQATSASMDETASGSLSKSSSTSALDDEDTDKLKENTVRQETTSNQKTKKDKKAERQKRFLEDMRRQFEQRAQYWETAIATEVKWVKSIELLVVAHFCRQNRVLLETSRNFEREEVWLQVFGPSSKRSEVLESLVRETIFILFPRPKVQVAGYNTDLNDRTGTIRYWDKSKQTFCVDLDTKKGKNSHEVFLPAGNLAANGQHYRPPVNKTFTWPTIQYFCANMTLQPFALDRQTVEQMTAASSIGSYLDELMRKLDEWEQYKRRMEEETRRTEEEARRRRQERRAREEAEWQQRSREYANYKRAYYEQYQEQKRAYERYRAEQANQQEQRRRDQWQARNQRRDHGFYCNCPKCAFERFLFSGFGIPSGSFRFSADDHHDNRNEEYDDDDDDDDDNQEYSSEQWDREWTRRHQQDVDTKNKKCAAILGISVEATPTEIKRAFRQLALSYHPDKYRPENCADGRTAEEAKMHYLELRDAHDHLLSNFD
jgi:hypothetical protein